MASLFQGDVESHEFFNIVCAPANMSLGQKTTFKGNEGGRDITYTPSTALQSLLTPSSNITNIAILIPGGGEPDVKELEALGKYDGVICATPECFPAEKSEARLFYAAPNTEDLRSILQLL